VGVAVAPNLPDDESMPPNMRMDPGRTQGIALCCVEGAGAGEGWGGEVEGRRLVCVSSFNNNDKKR
jgi:hypothetical protein